MITSIETSTGPIARPAHSVPLLFRRLHRPRKLLIWVGMQYKRAKAFG